MTEASPVHVDGRLGEGGGQVLRTSLALSIATGRALAIEHIRASRSRPGLRPQHLAAVRAAAAVGAARVEGAAVGSTTLAFEPHGLVPGTHRFDVGTAGSTTLVVQTVLPPLLRAGAPSSLVVEGGTHNPMAPPYEFLREVVLPALERQGHGFEAHLDRHGFAPHGGGRIRVDVHPTATPAFVDWLDRGRIESRHARAVVARLPLHVAERELAVVGKFLGWTEREREVLPVEADGPGNVLMLQATAKNARALVTAFGRVGVRAEEVAKRACREMEAWRRADVPVGEHLADQLLLPLALGAGGRFRTLALSSHARTQAELIPMFLDASITTSAGDGDTVVVEVRPPPAAPSRP